MKKLLIVLVGMMLLVGCGNDVSIEDIQSHIDTMKEHAELRKDVEQYKEDIQKFNKFLEEINNNKFSEYVKVQIEANNMRLEAIKNKDAELITNSSFKQAEAIQILEELKASN